MAMMGGSAWNGQDQGLHPSSAPVGDDEFQQFLDLNGMGTLADNIQFDFHDQPGQPHHAHAHPHAHPHSHAHTQSHNHLIHTSMAPAADALVVDTPMTGAHNPPGLLAQHQHQQHQHQQHQQQHQHQHQQHQLPTTEPLTSTPLMPSQNAGDAITEIDAQIQYLQQQRMQQQQRQIDEQNVAFFSRQNHIVPPTPQSLEIQAGTQYFASPDPRSQPQSHQQHPQQHHMYDRYHFKDQSFTPLVSPAVTPLETQFSMDTQFTVPGAYFSPLTSPALHAQADTSAVFDPRLASSASPLDMDLEMPPAATVTTPTTPTSVPPTSSPSSTALTAPTTSASVSNSSSGDLAKKARKNNASKARSKANVRQSPITKPMRKKSTTTPIINAQVLDQLAETLEHGALSSPVILQQQQHPSYVGSRMAGVHMSSSAGTTDSENGSVSPETLTDMPPPPLPTKPRSARPSPYLHPQNPSVGISLNGGFPSPATPASLMKLASPKQKSHKGATHTLSTSNNNSAAPSAHNTPAAAAAAASNLANEHIENFELPESLSMDFQKSLPPSSTVFIAPVDVSATASPSLEPRMTPGNPFHHPLHSPGLFAKPSSATHSPQLAPGSTSGTPLLGAARKTPQMLARASSASSKKRPSISSVQVSPALRPKISPSIKPLLPGGIGMSSDMMSAVEDQASRLLASKSNYQNILEGNTVPGVSYPSELSTNLTSKRTSHKIAEQGRRNRINQALQEIATLLPKPPPEDDEEAAEADSKDGNNKDKENDKKKDKGATPNSKASTVEMAIEYIKQLKKEVADLTERAEAAEAKLRAKEDEMVV